jgi:hypothetical protein
MMTLMSLNQIKAVIETYNFLLVSASNQREKSTFVNDLLQLSNFSITAFIYL